MNYNISKLADINPDLTSELRDKCYKVVGLCHQVHKEMGPFLNEYMYQEALDILFEENAVARVKVFRLEKPMFLLSRSCNHGSGCEKWCVIGVKACF